MDNSAEILRSKGIQPTAQRQAVARFILSADSHPSAEEVREAVQRQFPAISRATIYNTLNLFHDKGLVQRRVLKEGMVVFDPKTEAHHHLIDVDTGEIHDIPNDAIQVDKLDELKDYNVHSFHVVIHGRRKSSDRT